MTKKKIVPPTPPKFGQLQALSADGWDGVIDSPNPHYYGGADGLFLYRPSLLGRGMIRLTHWPKQMKRFGTDKDFDWTAEPIPAKIMGQIVSFFERIYDYQHTEAAVLLTMHADTREWRVFIPTQMLSHGGVNYVFDPNTIQYPWILVGSIHSHCDFGAGHSSTDTGDADGFDGFHATIGMIKRDVPQIVAMQSMNKNLMHYKPEDFPILFDFSEAKQHEAPKWWDRYCEDTKLKVKPVGFELFERFKRDTKVREENRTGGTIIRPLGPNPNPQPSQWASTDWFFSKAAGRMVHKNWIVEDDGTIHYPGTIEANKKAAEERSATTIKRLDDGNDKGIVTDKDWDDWDDFYRMQDMEGAPEGYEGFSPRQLMNAGYQWDPAAKNWIHSPNVNPDWSEDGELLGLWSQNDAALDGDKAEEYELFWENLISTQLLDTIFDSDLMDERDLDEAMLRPQEAATVEFWQVRFMTKAMRAVRALEEMGLELNFGLKGQPNIDLSKTPDRGETIQEGLPN